MTAETVALRSDEHFASHTISLTGIRALPAESTHVRRQLPDLTLSHIVGRHFAVGDAVADYLVEREIGSCARQSGHCKVGSLAAIAERSMAAGAATVIPLLPHLHISGTGEGVLVDGRKI